MAARFGTPENKHIEALMHKYKYKMLLQEKLGERMKENMRKERDERKKLAKYKKVRTGTYVPAKNNHG